MTNPLNLLLTSSKNPQMMLQRLPEVMSLLLIIACAYASANITWMLLLSDDQITAEPANVFNRQQLKQPNTQLLFRQLSNAHMFGVANIRTNINTTAPETKLNLILKGVLATIPMSASSAIIALSKNGKEEIYGIGDKLPGNVTVNEIHADHVVLNRGGRLETLRLPKNRSSNLIPSYSPRTKSVSLDPMSLGGVRNHLLKNPTSFADYALPVVVKENGKQIGYRLNFQKKGVVLRNAGVKATDIITSINGIKLDRPQKAMRAVRKLSTAKSINIIVRRDGMDIPINVQLQ